jgi:hypothetical protein
MLDVEYKTKLRYKDIPEGLVEKAIDKKVYTTVNL